MYSFIYTNYVDFEHIFTLTITKKRQRGTQIGPWNSVTAGKDKNLRTKKEMYQQIQSEVDSKLIYILIISYICEYMITKQPRAGIKGAFSRRMFLNARTLEREVTRELKWIH